MGPSLPTQDVYLRTAVNVGREGWAHFDHVVMKDYRWGIFLAERNPDRRIAFGEHKGEPACRRAPGGTRPDRRGLTAFRGAPDPAPAESNGPSAAPPRAPSTRPTLSS